MRSAEENHEAMETEISGRHLDDQMPFTYLGLPLSTTKPSVSEFMPILTRMERHLMGISQMLTYVVMDCDARGSELRGFGADLWGN
jgi:hypothetical protein